MPRELAEVDSTALLERGMYAELDEGETGGTQGEVASKSIPAIRSGTLIDQLRHVVADTIEFAGTEFAGVSLMEYRLIIDRSDLAGLDGDALQSVFFAAAFCAEKENEPEYLRYLEAAFKEKKVPLDRNFAYQKAVKLLHYKRRYDLYLMVSPSFAYQSSSHRVFDMPLDPTIRLDALETDPKLLSRLSSKNDMRSLITLISYGILSIDSSTPLTREKIFFALAEVDAPRRQIALAHLSEKYTLESIKKVLEGAIERSSRDDTGDQLPHLSSLVLRNLLEDLKEVESIVSDTGSAAISAIADMSEPKAYQEIRAIVPTGGKESEPVVLYPANAERQFIEKRNRTLRGESIPRAVATFKALAGAGKLEEYKEVALMGLDTIVTELANLVYDIEHHIQGDPTRATLAFNTLSLLIDTTAAAYALYHYSKDPAVFPLITRIKALEMGLTPLVEKYRTKDSGRLMISRTPSVNRPSEGGEITATNASFRGQIEEKALIESAIKSLTTAKLLHMDETSLRETRILWENLISRTDSPARSLTPDRIEILRNELEFIYKRTVKKRFEDAGIASEFISRIPFQNKEKVLSSIAGYGHDSVATEKNAASSRYKLLASEGVATDILEMLSVLGILEVRYIYLSGRTV